MPLEYFQSKELTDLRKRLDSWFLREARDLPWRRTKNPYHIWLSEIILQQTQVIQGLAYYERFIQTFPTVEDLASAEEDLVLKLWQGLGYYSRARNLKKAAQMIVEDFNGEIPQQVENIKQLPGVGPYTQAAILSFAYDLPHAAVDGNVYRVLSRLYALAEPIDKPKGQKLFRSLAQRLLNPKKPAQHNQAMIELGAICCTPRNPSCTSCPIDRYCLSYSEGTMLDFPKKVGKIKVRNRYFNYIYLRIQKDKAKSFTLIHRREEGDIWQGLYELPLIETDKDLDFEGIIKESKFKKLLLASKGAKLSSKVQAECQHRLSHQLLHSKLYVLEVEDIQLKDSFYQCIKEADFEDYAIPVLLEKLLSSAELKEL